MPFTPDPQLTFGALNLIGTDAELAANGYRYEALGDDLDWGSPVQIVEKIQSWLTDGALVENKGYDNRTMNIRVKVVADDSNLLAVAEAPLFLETGKPNLLVWTPPDGEGEPCVFSVVMSELVFVLNDLDENRIVRTYGLKLTAEPFVRSVDLTTVFRPAPTDAQTITSIDACTSFTGWAATFGYSPAGTGTQTSGNDGSFNYARSQNVSMPPGGVAYLFLTRTGLSADITATPYIRAIVRKTAVQAVVGAPALADFEINGVQVPVAVQEGDTYWFDTTGLGLGSTITSFKARARFAVTNPANQVALNVEDLSRSNVLGTQDTGKQLSRTVTVAGSARTQASLALADETGDALGTALVYTYQSTPGVVAPPIRTFLSAGGGVTAPDSDAVSGSSTEIDVPTYFNIPASGLAPGGYLFLSRVKHASSGDYSILYDFRGKQGSSTLDSGVVTGESSFSLTAGEYKVVTVASVNLPVVKVGSAGEVEINIFSADLLLFDEGWLFNVETGQLTVVECGTGTPAAGGPSNRLWLDAATVATPTPGIWLGTEDDRSDSFHGGVEIQSFGAHQFVPESVNVFTVTSGSQVADITVSYHPRWHTHVAAS